MTRLLGKVALVTGAAAGIGRAVVERFVEEGATVYATDVNTEELASMIADVSSNCGSVIGFQHDVASEASWSDVMNRVDRRIDIVVNNAGIGGYAPLRECTLDFWRKVMSVNLDGVFLGCRFGVEAMLYGDDAVPGAGGSIINISSVYGIVGRAGSSAYSASKGGVRLMTKSLALEAAQNRWNIRVNSVHPGFVETPLIQRALQNPKATANGSLNMEGLAAMHPIGRLAQPKEVADAVLFLASDQSGFVTGSEMLIDGGFTAI